MKSYYSTKSSFPLESQLTYIHQKIHESVTENYLNCDKTMP